MNENEKKVKELQGPEHSASDMIKFLKELDNKGEFQDFVKDQTDSNDQYKLLFPNGKKEDK